MKLVCSASAGLVAAVFLGLGVLPAAHPQGYVPTSVNCPGPCDPSAQYFYTNWVDIVELDGDGDAEFRHWSFTTYQVCQGCGQNVCGYSTYTDSTEALFPAERVHLYAEVQQGLGFVTAVVTNGQPVLADPGRAGTWDPYWAWNAPEAVAWLQIVGLGIGSRRYEWGVNYPPGFPPTVEYSSYGQLNEQATNCLFGFRVSKADGWHLGWVRLVRGLVSHTPGPDSAMQLAEYDVHPEPNTEILAGQYAQPRLEVTLAGDKVIVSWPPGYRGSRLERTIRLDPPNWLPGPPMDTNVVLFDASDAPWFFRLKR